MKTRQWLLTLVAAISGLAMFASPAEAGGKKKHHHHDDWNDGSYIYRRADWDNGGYRYYRPYYYRRGYDYPPPYYGPAYYRRAPGVVVEFGFE